MTERLLKFPVKCPICGTEWISAYGTPIRAYAECHDWE
jgi:hypothetical protein